MTPREMMIDYRTRNQMTPKQLAAILQCSAASICSIEAGRVRIGRHVATKLAAVLQVPVEDLMVRAPEKNAAPTPSENSFTIRAEIDDGTLAMSRIVAASRNVTVEEFLNSTFVKLIKSAVRVELNSEYRRFLDRPEEKPCENPAARFDSEVSAASRL